MKTSNSVVSLTLTALFSTPLMAQSWPATPSAWPGTSAGYEQHADVNHPGAISQQYNIPPQYNVAPAAHVAAGPQPFSPAQVDPYLAPQQAPQQPCLDCPCPGCHCCPCECP